MYNTLFQKKGIIMKGTINSIWLTNNQKLHPQIIPNLSKMVKEAKEEGFQLILWTNISQVQPDYLNKLKSLDIQVKDYSECKQSKLYIYFNNFFEKGLKGDNAAFALAADILRMSILEQTPDQQYFIYHDPNDITFLNLKKSLKDLDKMMSTNSLGFSFPIYQLDSRTFEVRNDLLIAKKEKNKSFFKDFFNSYQNHLKLNYKTYHKPISDVEAQAFARQISNQTSISFFTIYLTKPLATIKATFGSYDELYPLINCLAFFPYDRHFEHANTWLPQGKCEEDIKKLEKLQLLDIFMSNQN